MQISREFHTHGGKYTPGGNSCRYIVVHNTGNTASARNEASFAASSGGLDRPSSYHYVLDGSNPVYQLLDDTDTAWAVGAWKGAVQYIGNDESVSIEVCSNGTEFTGAEIAQLTELVGILMKRHNIPAERVVRHWDAHSGHKQCPAWYVPQDRWNALWSVITSGIIENGEIRMSECIFQPNDKKYLVWFDGTRAHGLAHPHEVDAINMVYKACHDGKSIPQFALGHEGSPWATRFKAALDRGWPKI